MKVSVISTLKNEAKTVRKLLDSLINQSLKPDEIIIVDGGSTDGTWEILQEYSKKYPFIKIIREEGANIARGRNIAIKNAKNELIATIDGGCYADKDWLKNLVKRWKETKGDVIAGVFKPWIETEWDKIEGYFQCPDINKLRDGWEPSSRSQLIRKEFWKKVGGYPENLYTAEDTLFNKKLKKVGAKYYLARDAVVYWRMRRSLRKIFKQFYLYGKGDVQAGTWKEKYKLIFLLISINIPFLVFLEVLKKYIQYKDPILWKYGIFISCAKRLGFLFGVIINLFLGV